MSIICSICIDPITSNPVPGQEGDWDGHHSKTVPKIFITECGHPFHEYCLNKWLKQSNKCPLNCVKRVDAKNCRRMFPVGDTDIKEAAGPTKLLKTEIATLRKENAQLGNRIKIIDAEKSKQAQKLQELRTKNSNKARQLVLLSAENFRQALDEERLREQRASQTKELAMYRTKVLDQITELRTVRLEYSKQNKKYRELGLKYAKKDKKYLALRSKVDEMKRLIDEHKLVADIVGFDNKEEQQIKCKDATGKMSNSEKTYCSWTLILSLFFVY